MHSYIENSADDALELIAHYSTQWRNLWEAGEGMKDDPQEDFFLYAAVSILLCQLVESKAGFFIRRTSRKIRQRIEAALVQSGHMRKTIQTFEQAAVFLELRFPAPKKR